MSENEHAGLMADPHTWVLLSALVFAGLAWAKGRKTATGALDARTRRIRDELDEAARLRREAESILADYRKKQADAMATAQKIIDQANDAATRMKKDAEDALDARLRRQEALLNERIARAESMAVDALRRRAADLAVQTAENLLAARLDETQDGALADALIAALPASSPQN